MKTEQLQHTLYFAQLHVREKTKINKTTCH